MFKTKFERTSTKGVKFEIPSEVQQCDKDSTDINKIIKRYGVDCTCAMCAANARQPISEDVAALSSEDFNSMMQKMAQVNNQFNELPADVRKKFDNNPANMLEFMHNPANKEECVKYGLIEKSYNVGTDIALPDISSPVTPAVSMDTQTGNQAVQGNKESSQVSNPTT